MSDAEEKPEKPAEREKKGWIDWFQGNILADRYLETVLADWKNTFLLLAQAPILAGLAVMVWGNVGKANNAFYFVMTLSMIWIGCMDSCREIVKERALFLREKMAGLDVGAYIYSKIRILGLLACLQAAMYGGIVYYFLDVRIPVGWLIINLIASTVCGTCLGLLISAVVNRSDYAVGLVPLVILPQILFSEFAIKEDQFAGVSETIYTLMPSRWGYESLLKLAETASAAMEAMAMLVPLFIFGLIFLALAYPVLKIQKY